MLGIPTSIPKIVQRLYPRRLWEFTSKTKNIYLTFDDGPITQVTPWVLQTLKKYEAKATFFCIGENIKKQPLIFTEILKQGHSVGNHTQHHKNGWKTNNNTYFQEITTCQKTIEETKSQALNLPFSSSNLYRPPFGKMTSKQAQWAIANGYKIVMWNVLSKDYDPTILTEKSLKSTLKYLKPGSIVVLHDSLKAEKKLKYILPKVLEHCVKKGWKCEAIKS